MIRRYADRPIHRPLQLVTLRGCVSAPDALPSRRPTFAECGFFEDDEAKSLAMGSLAVMKFTKGPKPVRNGTPSIPARIIRGMVIRGPGASHTQAAAASCEVVTLP